MLRTTLFHTQKGTWEVKLDGGRVQVDPTMVPDHCRRVQLDTGQFRFDVLVAHEGANVHEIRPWGIGHEPPAPLLPVSPGTVFRNPYNFVPFEDRAGFEGPLADSPPVGHAAYHPDAWSGTITVRGTVRTPLIITPAAPEAMTGEHPTYGCRVGADGTPWLPPSALRGALRGRYEALTDSRFGVVSEVLDRRFAFRLGTSDAQRAVPARVADVDGQLSVVPLLGTSATNRADNQPLWAAWLPMNCNEADQLAHGTFVRARLRRCTHVNRNGGARYPIWYVERAVPAGRQLPPDPWKPRGRTAESVNRYERSEQTLVVHGWVFRTSPAPNLPSTKTRKFERLFFVQNTAAAGTTEQQVIDRAAQQAGQLVAPFAGDLKDGFEAVIKAYDDAAPERARGQQLNGSAHLPEHGSAAHREPRPGLLCYAILRPDHGAIGHLSPVTIGREPYQSVARDLLPDRVDVARNWSELSPADRVFGWVHPEAGEGDDRRVALRSSLRISPCRFDPPGEGEPPLIDTSVRTLAILSGPKPSYGRFYLAGADGQPADGGHKRTVGYQPSNRLRGRKVYPHQPDAESPDWFNPGGRKPWETNETTNKNRTVTACVRAGASFTFDIQVRNLSSAELGALLEVIDRASGGGRIRLGYARPLGFGSVELERQQVRVETGQQRRQRLAQFDTAPAGPCSDEVVGKLRQSFLKAFIDAHGAPLHRHGIGWASKAEACGFDDGIVVAYPGVADGRPSYEWFMDNENTQRRGNPGAQEALDVLAPTRPYRNARNV